MNQYETEAMAELFKKVGYEIVDESEVAGVYVINTCTVTSLSDRKSRQFMRRSKAKNPDAVLAVVGCYSQVSPEEVAQMEEVDIILGTSDRNRIVELCEEYTEKHSRINLVRDIMGVKDFEEMGIEDTGGKTRAFLKIQEGCNQYCSYCIIPYARGPIRSRDMGSIVSEVKSLAQNGFKEVVLTGIHVASYGKDLKDEISLIDVLEMVNSIDGIERIRLSSIEPNVATDEFLERYSSLEKACNHFHLSLQSGDDAVLKRMNRKYDTAKYYEGVERIRKYLPDVSFTTDIIVGFPGETEAEHRNSYEFAKRVGFSRIHVFQYSPRKGTPAADYSDQVSGPIKQVRSKEFIELGKDMSKDFNEKHVGQVMKVLFEEKAKDIMGYIEGYTTNYIRVKAQGDIESYEGKIVGVKILSADENCALGEIV